MANLPSLYEYYTGGGITQGLSVDQPHFTLNNKNISLYSGSMHYFRVPPQYWRDRLRKMRAAGLNAVQTYVPWNLHEPEPGKYDFGEGGTDMQDFLNIETFLKTAQEEDLFVIMRPGPFICAEFEFGGLPSWLLRQTGIKFRTHDKKFMEPVTSYFMVLLSLLSSFQFTKGGPIISFQIENEYGSTKQPDANPPFLPDKIYLEQLRQLMLDSNITELLFTSDSPTSSGSLGSLSSLFQTANFGLGDPTPDFDKLKELQGNKPTMSTEFWSGWFNHWSEDKYNGNIIDFTSTLEKILKYPASVNFYMFHGGTSWGFLNGANMDNVAEETYHPDITSYDYDAPISEAGDYQPKYFVVKELIEKYNNIKTKLPHPPKLIKRKAYASIDIKRHLPYEYIVSNVPVVKSNKVVPMELLPINNNIGQKYGYIIYRKTNITLLKGSKLVIKDYVYDTINVYINNQLMTNNFNDISSFGYWKTKDGSIIFNTTYKTATIDLVVCNMGRNNFGSLDQFYQFKGLKSAILLDEKEIKNWEILPLEFKQSWIKELSSWQDYDKNNKSGAGLYQAELVLNDITDTYIDMSRWKKGIVIINNFVLGRYWTIGPQQSLYLPATFLKTGVNSIIVFEEFLSDNEIRFLENPIYFNNK